MCEFSGFLIFPSSSEELSDLCYQNAAKRISGVVLSAVYEDNPRKNPLEFSLPLELAEVILHFGDSSSNPC